MHPLLEEGLEIKSMRLGLERMLLLDRLLDYPSRSFSTIHVGGTNGKGSVATKIAASLQAAGKKVGLYTSPHLFSFCERVSVDGQNIPEEEADRLLTKIVKRSPFKLSYFEILTLLAFCYFEEKAVDMAVIEVGMGGRLDATNIIHPLLAVITSIAFDHCQYLGDSLEAIAYEKGGIVKQGVPLLLGPKAEPYSVFEKIAIEKRSPLMQVKGVFRHYEEENKAIAQQALSILQVEEKTVMKGIEAVPLCRFQVVRANNPLVIFDVAHNPDGLERTFERLQATFPKKKVRTLAAFSKDKEIASCIAILHKHASSVTLTQANHPRACPISAIKGCRTDADLCRAFEKNYQEAAAQDEILLVCGTFFMMEQIRSVGSRLGLELGSG